MFSGTWIEEELTRRSSLQPIDIQSALNQAQALCCRLETLWGPDLSAQALEAGCSPNVFQAAISVQQRGSVGVYLSGTTVVDFVPGSPAADCGMLKGDKILKVDGRPVDNKTVSSALHGATSSDAEAVVEVQRRKNSAAESPLSGVSSLFSDRAFHDTHVIRVMRHTAAPRLPSPPPLTAPVILAALGGGGSVLGGEEHAKDQKAQALEDLLLRTQLESNSALNELTAAILTAKHLAASPANPPTTPSPPTPNRQHSILRRASLADADDSRQPRGSEGMRLFGGAGEAGDGRKSSDASLVALECRIGELSYELSSARTRLAEMERQAGELAVASAEASRECRRIVELAGHMEDLQSLEAQVRAFAPAGALRDGSVGGEEGSGEVGLPVTVFSKRSTWGVGGENGVERHVDEKQRRRVRVLLPGEQGGDAFESNISFNRKARRVRYT